MKERKIIIHVQHSRKLVLNVVDHRKTCLKCSLAIYLGKEEKRGHFVTRKCKVHLEAPPIRAINELETPKFTSMLSSSLESQY